MRQGLALLGADQEKSTAAEQKQRWEAVALDKGSAMLAEMCEVRNLSAARLATVPVADVAAMLKRDNPGLAVSLAQLEKAVAEYVRRAGEPD